MSRWKYKQATVTAGENSQTVRQLTAEERGWVAGARAKLGDPKTADKEALVKIQQEVVRKASVNPELSEQDVAEMPGDLLDACASKVMELTLGPDWNKDDEGDPEKKASEGDSPAS